MAEIDDFDLDRSTARAWTEFQSRLSEVISLIDDSADLTIGTASASEAAAPFIRFSSPARHQVRAEAASNAVLGEDFQLSPDQMAALVSLGWRAPSSEDSGSGSTALASFSVERPQDDSDHLAEMAVAALRDVYGVQHPVFLAPDQLAEVLHTAPPAIETPTGPVRTEFSSDDLLAVVPASRQHLEALVETQLAAILGYPPIRDDEGDVVIRVGSTMVFLRTSADAREVVLFAAVVHDVAGRSRATEVLNDLNAEARWVKFQLVRDRVFVTSSVHAHPFVPAHLSQAVQIMSKVADGIDDELAAKLNGRTTFNGHDEPS